MVRNQIRASPCANCQMARKARRLASCTTSSASVALPVSQRASAYAWSRCGSTTCEKSLLRSAALRGGALTAFGVAVAGAEHDAFPEAADRSPQSNAIVIGDEPHPSPHDARGYA